MTTEVKIRLTSEMEEWLYRSVDERRFYLHNSYGGRGWRVRMSRTDLHHIVEFDDESVALEFILRWR